MKSFKGWLRQILYVRKFSFCSANFRLDGFHDMMDVECDFRTMEGALARQFHIADNKRSTFASRLKNFERLGLIETQEKRPGKARMYDRSDVVLFALALEMTNLGLKPETVVKLIAMNLYTLIIAASRMIEQARGYTAPDDDGSSPAVQFLVFDPSSLSTLQSSLTEDYETAVSFTMITLNEDQLANHLPNMTFSARRSLSAINLSALFEGVTYHLASITGAYNKKKDNWKKMYNEWLPAETEEKAVEFMKGDSEEFIKESKFQYFLNIKSWIYYPGVDLTDVFCELLLASIDEVHEWERRFEREGGYVDPQA